MHQTAIEGEGTANIRVRSCAAPTSGYKLSSSTHANSTDGTCTQDVAVPLTISTDGGQEWQSHLPCTRMWTIKACPLGVRFRRYSSKEVQRRRWQVVPLQLPVESVWMELLLCVTEETSSYDASWRDRSVR